MRPSENFSSSWNTARTIFKLCSPPPAKSRPRLAERGTLAQVFCEIGGFVTIYPDLHGLRSSVVPHPPGLYTHVDGSTMVNHSDCDGLLGICVRGGQGERSPRRNTPGK